jgi:hypothetical protein
MNNDNLTMSQVEIERYRSALKDSNYLTNAVGAIAECLICGSIKLEPLKQVKSVVWNVGQKK